MNIPLHISYTQKNGRSLEHSLGTPGFFIPLLFSTLSTTKIMKLIWTIFSFLIVNTMFAQSNSETTTTPVPDQRLYEVYETDYIDRLVTENPFLIKRWNYYLDNAFYIMDAVPGKTDDKPEVTITDISNINILLLEKEQKLTHDFKGMTIYNIKNTNKCLVYLPGEKFVKLLNAALAKSK